jgi:ABC-type bacteriocin/lantibiotic exporter with double-glycine peptidase domain
MELLPVFLSTLNQISVLIVGFLLVLQGKLTIGMLLAAQMVAMALSGEIQKTLTFLRGLSDFEASLLRLEDVIEQPHDPLLTAAENITVISPGSPDLLSESSRLSGAIEIVELSFGYIPIKPPLIVGLNMRVDPGQRIASLGSISPQPAGCCLMAASWRNGRGPLWWRRWRWCSKRSSCSAAA